MTNTVRSPSRFLSTLFLVALLGCGLLFVGCADNDGPMEEAGETLDEAMDDAGDALEEAGDEVEEAVQGVEDGLENAADEIEDAVDDNGDGN